MTFTGEIRDLGIGLLEEIRSENENILKWKEWLKKYRFSPDARKALIPGFQTCWR